MPITREELRLLQSVHSHLPPVSAVAIPNEVPPPPQSTAPSPTEPSITAPVAGSGDAPSAPALLAVAGAVAAVAGGAVLYSYLSQRRLDKAAPAAPTRPTATELVCVNMSAANTEALGATLSGFGLRSAGGKAPTLHRRTMTHCTTAGSTLLTSTQAQEGQSGAAQGGAAGDVGSGGGPFGGGGARGDGGSRSLKGIISRLALECQQRALEALEHLQHGSAGCAVVVEEGIALVGDRLPDVFHRPADVSRRHRGEAMTLVHVVALATGPHLPKVFVVSRRGAVRGAALLTPSKLEGATFEDLFEPTSETVLPSGQGRRHASAARRIGAAGTLLGHILHGDALSVEERAAIIGDSLTEPHPSGRSVWQRLRAAAASMVPFVPSASAPDAVIQALYAQHCQDQGGRPLGALCPRDEAYARLAAFLLVGCDPDVPFEGPTAAICAAAPWGVLLPRRLAVPSGCRLPGQWAATSAAWGRLLRSSAGKDAHYTGRFRCALCLDASATNTTDALSVAEIRRRLSGFVNPPIAWMAQPSCASEVWGVFECSGTATEALALLHHRQQLAALLCGPVVRAAECLIAVDATNATNPAHYLPFISHKCPDAEKGLVCALLADGSPRLASEVDLPDHPLCRRRGLVPLTSDDAAADCAPRQRFVLLSDTPFPHGPIPAGTLSRSFTCLSAGHEGGGHASTPEILHECRMPFECGFRSITPVLSAAAQETTCWFSLVQLQF